jgi:hypothetical protein
VTRKLNSRTVNVMICSMSAVSSAGLGKRPQVCAAENWPPTTSVRCASVSAGVAVSPIGSVFNVGQPIIGVSASNDVAVSAGSIPCLIGSVSEVTIPGDMDNDGDVDLFDYAAFQTCVTGIDGGPASQECAPGDFDFDDDIDLIDFAGFQAAFTDLG